jgi:hypothetical protein
MMAKTRHRRPRRPRRRGWKPRPDRKWGWVSTDGHWEIEWRRAEGDTLDGYYLFGPGCFGDYLGVGVKPVIQQRANMRRRRKAPHWEDGAP